MKYLMILFLIASLLGCNPGNNKGGDDDTHKALKTVEAGVFDTIHLSMRLICEIPIAEERQRLIENMSRDVWQRGYADGKPFLVYVWCPQDLEVVWNEGKFPPTPPVNIDYLTDTNWEPGECPSKWTNYGCPDDE